MHKNHLDRVRERPWFGLKYPVLSPQKQVQNVATPLLVLSAASATFCHVDMIRIETD